MKAIRFLELATKTLLDLEVNYQAFGATLDSFEAKLDELEAVPVTAAIRSKASIFDAFNKPRLLVGTVPLGTVSHEV